MLARSKPQQIATGAALSAKGGETEVSKLQYASKDMHDHMTKRELEEMAGTDRTVKP